MPARSPGRTSPLVRRRRLAAEMRRLRTDLGKTREEAAKFAGVAPATITRMEAAQHSPKPSDVLALCQLYGVPEEQTEALVTLARQSRQRGWWQRFHGTIPEWFVFYVGLEEEVAEIRGYHPELVSGLLQTEDYTKAVMLADVASPAEEELQRRLAVRRKRRERLDGPDALRLHVILHEAVLRHRAEAVMPEQLHHLAELSRRDNVTLQILPFSAGFHPAVDGGAFEILGLPDPADPDIVYIQHHTGGIYLEDPSDLAVYTEVFTRLQTEALTPEDSLALLSRLAAGE